MEVGTALSVVSLTFQVFSGCVQGYQLLADAKHMPSDYQYLRVRLKTEQYRLLDWAHVVQLDEQDENLLISNSSKGLLLDVLDQKRRLLYQFGRLDGKYKRMSKPLLVDSEEANNGVTLEPPEYSEMSPTVQRVNSDFDKRFPQSEVLLKKSLEFVKRSGENTARRLKWASFDSAKMEGLILKVSTLNDYMRELLNSTQLQNLAIKQQRTEFQIMQLNNNIQDLVQIFASAAITMKSQTKRSRFPSANPVKAYMQIRGLDDIDEENGGMEPALQNLATLAQTKALNSAIEDPNLYTDELKKSLALPHTRDQIRAVELSRSDITILSDEPDDSGGESQRVEAIYQPPHSRKTSVWVEWKTYEPPTFQSTSPDKKIHERVAALAALLKENNRLDQFRAPHCLGYFRDIDASTQEDHCRFGLVFEKPASAHATTKPISLHSLLTASALNQLPVPSLTHRITLMRLLAETIERLHAVNWLHKGLRSSNILFFSDSGPADILYEHPYISGFDYSRPAMNDDMTEKPPENAASDIYRHPRVQGSGDRSSPYKKSYDLYSLGVIFLEIAYWKPIDVILEIKDLSNARPSTTIKVRQSLLGDEKGNLKWVRSFLGDRVEGVVRACLEGPTAFGFKTDNLDERKEEVGAQLQSMFYEKVVKELGDMRV
ncbi:prion-inhibition and propagation-domain-containing protein [Clohesyomyces aquaticus]|uniref:Prion-inhibition and propagation-domain-containing protein n=1 Tax=Clohesyomyces aquaticus TaxID=1231657 RepID=A0A1Y1ZXH1_9PLEO|nr:prion-inhibition and propagation-domain-containing protein [Clohesyomyces aquaticus]